MAVKHPKSNRTLPVSLAGCIHWNLSRAAQGQCIAINKYLFSTPETLSFYYLPSLVLLWCLSRIAFRPLFKLVWASSKWKLNVLAWKVPFIISNSFHSNLIVLNRSLPCRRDIGKGSFQECGREQGIWLDRSGSLSKRYSCSRRTNRKGIQLITAWLLILVTCLLSCHF